MAGTSPAMTMRGLVEAHASALELTNSVVDTPAQGEDRRAFLLKVGGSLRESSS
jgi:hypothetical protein